MSTTEAMTSRQSEKQRHDDRAGRLERLRHAIEHAGHLLPSQGPITVFVHHNTLHAFEDLPFDEAVKSGGKTFGCEPYLAEERYREALERGRIRAVDLEAVLRRDLSRRSDEPILSLGTRFDLRLAMLTHSIQSGPAAELRWFVAETDALERIRPDAPPAARERLLADARRWAQPDSIEARQGTQGRAEEDRLHKIMEDALHHFGDPTKNDWSSRTWEKFMLQTLWRICREGTRNLKPVAASPPAITRHRDLLFQATACDIDLLVNDVLIRYCAAYLDQGFAHRLLPDRDRGFFQSFCTIHRQPFGSPERWQRGLEQELTRLQDGQIGPLACLAESLDRLGIREEKWDQYLSATLLSLRGWAGMIQQVESRSDRVVHAIRPGSLVEFLAIRLVLERFALQFVAREALGYTGPLADLPKAAKARIPHATPPVAEKRAFVVFQLAQLLGWTPSELHRLSKQEWSTLIEEIESFSNIDRRRILHGAYERRYFNQTLDAVATHAKRSASRPEKPWFQAVFCIDDREESFRRHLEEASSDIETFAAAGFFNVPIYFKGAADAHYTPLCPVIIRPKHWVTEEVAHPHHEEHVRRTSLRRAIGTATHRIHVGSRTFTSGALLSAGVGLLASVPLISRILLPRLAARVRQSFSRFIEPPPLTQLRLERTEETAGPEGGHIGFSVEEMANAAEMLLRDIGLTSRYGRFVLIIGHGSSSLNNPHMSAYGCGACAGAYGGPNARAVSQMLNDPRVRTILAERGLPLPDDTLFVGGFHNTCKDSVTFYDVDRIPASIRADFDEVRKTIEETCDRNAHERCRRFESAPLSLSPAGARRHVEERSEDLAQPRPELGHVTNAVTIVGRRSRTRGLYLDRRAFLTCYDPTQDDADATILLRLLQAAIPVCAGIGLEYYFSHVDPQGYGCSTKLPQNVSALLGVMDGAASDLRTGLPWQMVEIHEPLRPLFVIETTPEVMLNVMERNASIGQLCHNEWILLATLSPDSSDLHLFRDGVFQPYTPETTELPSAKSSFDWYSGWRNNLDFAQIPA